MNNILLITTTYKCGEKIYPIIPELSKHFNVDVLHMFKMSRGTEIPKNADYRDLFKDRYNSYIRNEYHGPRFFRDTNSNGPHSKKFIDDFEDTIKNGNYSIVLWDNNIPTKGGCVVHFYNLFSKYGIKVIGSPHGNRDFAGYKLSKRFRKSYDQSFVFGNFERKAISNIRKGTKLSKDNIFKRLIPAGIPANDALKNYEKKGEYILIIPNFTKQRPVGTVTGKFAPLTAKTFKELGIRKISKNFGVPIVVKEKMREFYQEDEFRDTLNKYGDVTFISHCEDDNKLMANAKIVIGAPSTFMFKPIQLGIPTVLLNKHGMIGNFNNYPGLINPSYKNILDSVELQIKHGRFESFIEESLSGGVDFSSTKIYIDNIKRLGSD